MLSATPRVAAVAVTHNRASLVTRLVQAVSAGTVVPDTIIVVDNASTDDTVARLRGMGGVEVIELGTNTGGAGGFAEGMRQALATNADLLWLMDDDGVPAPDCLELLLAQMAQHDFIGPVVVTEGDERQLVFPMRLPGTGTVLREVSKVERRGRNGLVEGIVIPFNGVLLRRELIEQIGVVEADYFIWGDDVEYLWRAEKYGARIATVTAARFRHPSVGELGTPMAFGQTYNHSPSDLKAYCMARNNWVNLRKYKGLPHALAFVAKTIWFYTLTRPDLPRLRLMVRGISAGMRGDFTGHRRFLIGAP